MTICCAIGSSSSAEADNGGWELLLECAPEEMRTERRLTSSRKLLGDSVEFSYVLLPCAGGSAALAQELTATWSNVGGISQDALPDLLQGMFEPGEDGVMRVEQFALLRPSGE